MLIRGNKQKKNWTHQYSETISSALCIYVSKIKLPDMSERFRQRLYDGA